jgi:tRNA A37 threonylcarbamoyladenosine synthetase subunit TsaC/SUA5/YrdC
MQELFKKDTLFLSSTDTAIGFLSKSKTRLNLTKQRSGKEYIMALASLKELKAKVPKPHRKRVRRAKRVSFILPGGFSFRIVRDKEHLLLLERLKWLYTTSANLTGKGYDEEFATSKADIIIYPLKQKSPPSKIFKLSKTKKLKKIR